MHRKNITPKQIDAILPQTQCGLCSYKGCMPYAEALVHDQAAIDLCPPGGVEGLKKIATLVNEDPTPFLANMEKKSKPPLLAVIREAECIGCTKCIQACPVDAILGSAKQMHTIIADECTGCELCIAPCPVDCIDLVPLAEKSESQKEQQANLARQRFNSREQRLKQEPFKQRPTPSLSPSNQSIDEKKAFIEAAILRAKIKKTK
jgi:electron transport complex protein RnfB